jgi:glycosyltransferase involved in cell wall biosynthesis
LKKVLYITYDGLTDPLGQSQVLPYLQHLSKTGFAFTILSFEKRDRFDKEGSIIQAIVDKAGIRWVPRFFTATPPVLSKLYDRYQVRRAAIALHRKERFDAVHCRSYVAAEVGLLLKQRFGVKMLFDMRGFWADEKVDNGQWDLRKPFYKQLYRFYKKKEKAFLLGADAIISLTDKAKAYLLQQSAYSGLSIDVIPCCADLEHFNYFSVDERAVAALKQQLGIPDSAKVLTYLGSVGGWYMTEEMFRFFVHLQKRHPEYVLLVLTKDDARAVQAEATACGVLPGNIIVKYAIRTELPIYLALSTCSIFFIRNTFSKIASSPTKHAELMGMGIPVICNDIGDTGALINRTGTGLLIDEFGTKHLEDVVAAIPNVEQLPKAHIRRCAEDLFDLQSGVQKYLQVYQQMFQL